MFSKSNLWCQELFQGTHLSKIVELFLSNCQRSVKQEADYYRTSLSSVLSAKFIQSNARRDGAFVCLNCRAIPRELIESELFGYESGAFTGASKKGKPDKIEPAHRGSLFLDEIGDLPQDAQAALLRVLETKVVDKVGGLKAVEVDFRLLAARYFWNAGSLSSSVVSTFPIFYPLGF